MLIGWISASVLRALANLHQRQDAEKCWPHRSLSCLNLVRYDAAKFVAAASDAGRLELVVVRSECMSNLQMPEY